ncbi:DUF2795 domain-containing protein [Streptomyces griseus]|uniref:DUF2795 domain-containing protein n=1 Tax=Streptomyces griseus TaxID=1911 RepID=UPI00084025AF|nr:DUF2795 domain-containing protein [Streptomyces griseus]
MSSHGKDKTGPVRDDEMKKELQGELKGGRGARVREERELQPAGEDQPAVGRSPNATLPGSTPPGMTREDVELRTELARHLGRGPFPADREKVIRALRDDNAPDALVDTAAHLPDDTQYGNVQDLLRGLGRA